MTLQKVAKLAGVSVSTASKALSDSKEVSGETKALVMKAAEELGYFTKVKKRRFENRRHSSSVIGIICPEIISVHYSELVTALCRKIDEMGGKVSVFISEFDTKKLKSIFDRCVSENEIDGILCLEGGEMPFETLDYPIPVVYLSNCGRYSVHTDMRDGIYKAVAHFVEMGHKKIGFAGEPLTVIKQEWFKQAMEDMTGSFDEKLIFCEEGRFEQSGHAAGMRIVGLEKKDRPTAILCAYDEIAYGLMRVLRENFLRIPDDISVIGINDIPTSRFLDTPLTSVRNDTEKIVEKAMEMLLLQLSGEKTGEMHLAVPCELAVRSSVAKI
ncbi:MAG: LacI family transcriptional regulator [Ruminococcaceae bacterium]|nr:LacI family transcriptional regulator [Oscillospiraceae bacterium]